MEVNDPITINAGWLVDGSGGPVRRDVAIEVNRGRITRIHSAVNIGPPGSDVFDFSTGTVLPCLVDSHVHLFMSGSTAADVRKTQLEAGFAEAQKGIARRIERHAAHGILAVRDGGDRCGHTLRFCRESLSRRFPGFTVRAAGRAWRSPGRYGRLIGGTPEDGRSLADSVAGAVNGIDHVKIVNSGLNSLLSFGKTTSPQFSSAQIAAAVRTAKAAGRTVMVHANGPEPVRTAVEAGCHSVEHGFFMGTDNLHRMAERRTVWVPTAVTMNAYAESLPRGSREADGAARNLDHQLGQIAAARRIGVVVAAGSDAGSLNVHHGSGLVEEMKLLAAAGCRIEEAVRCASAVGARLLGVERVGNRLAPGRPASFVVCPGSPEALPDSLYRIEAVVVDGRKIGNRKEERADRKGERSFRR
jgi:imidazolonepropionase-like amidohydrolase